MLFLLCAVPTQWRAALIVTPTGVFARTQLGRRNQCLTWAEIHHFEMRGYWRGLCAVTLDGRVRSLLLFGAATGGADGVWCEVEDYRWQQQQALGLA